MGKKGDTKLLGMGTKGVVTSTGTPQAGPPVVSDPQRRSFLLAVHGIVTLREATYVMQEKPKGEQGTIQDLIIDVNSWAECLACIPVGHLAVYPKCRFAYHANCCTRKPASCLSATG